MRRSIVWNKKGKGTAYSSMTGLILNTRRRTLCTATRGSTCRGRLAPTRRGGRVLLPRLEVSTRPVSVSTRVACTSKWFDRVRRRIDWKGRGGEEVRAVTSTSAYRIDATGSFEKTQGDSRGRRRLERSTDRVAAESKVGLSGSRDAAREENSGGTRRSTRWWRYEGKKLIVSV